MDELAPSLPMPVFAQVGLSNYRPNNIEWSQTLTPQEFDKKLESSNIIVAHAGIGTVLSAQRRSKPIILFPRERQFGEHRNDHQLATCRQLAGRVGINFAYNGEQLAELLVTGSIARTERDGSLVSRQALVENLSSYLRRVPVSRKAH